LETTFTATLQYKVGLFIICTFYRKTIIIVIARMGEMRNAYKIFIGKPEWKEHKGVRVDGRIILKFILNTCK
jgi:hypothetical protein